MKVSFDFDGTLDKGSVQKYAAELIARGFTIYVVTARLNDLEAPDPDWNKDLYKVCDSLSIQRENIIFMSLLDKYHFFEKKDFVWHLDDDWEEVDLINKNTNTIGITLFGNPDWREKCEKFIKLDCKDHTKTRQVDFLDHVIYYCRYCGKFLLITRNDKVVFRAE